VRGAGGEIEEHQSVCGFEPVGCSNQCGLKVTRNRIQTHLNTVCTKRQVGGHFGGFLQCDISLAQLAQNKRFQEMHRTRGNKGQNKTRDGGRGQGPGPGHSWTSVKYRKIGSSRSLLKTCCRKLLRTLRRLLRNLKRLKV
jgi:hypothetical protein